MQTFQDDEAYHFVGYMPIDGRLYELDGLREGPIDHGPIAPDQDWLDVVRPIILKRINMYVFFLYVFCVFVILKVFLAIVHQLFQNINYISYSYEHF